MAESLGSAVLSLTTDDRALEAGLARGEARAEATAARFTAIGGRMKDVGAKLSVAMTLPIGAFGVASFNAASDAAELQSAFAVTFGAMSKDMEDWARRTGDAMGRSTQEIQQAANTFGMFFNQAAPTKKAAAEMSQQFAVLAQDLSSFFNVDPDEAMEKLRSGLSGETEPLRDFGVFMTEASVKAKALQMGLGGVSGELTEQEKILVRAAIIMDSTTKAQGDVARTSSGTANQVRAARAAWDELQVAVGTRLLPIFTPLITGLSAILNGVTGLPAPVQTVIMVVGGLAAGAGPLLVALGLMSSGIGTLIPMATGLGTAFTVVRTAALTTLPALAPFLLPLAAIAAAVGAVWLAWKNWDTIAPVLSGLWGDVSATLGPPLVSLLNTVKAVLTDLWNGPFGTLLREAAGRVVAQFGAVLARLGEAGSAFGTFAATVMNILGPVLAGVFNGFVAYVETAVRVVGDLLNAVAALLRGDFTGAWTYARKAVTDTVGGLSRVVEAVVTGMLSSLQRLVVGVRDWLSTRLAPIFDGVRDRIQAVGDKFKWLWDVVVGHSYVPDLVDGIAEHFARLDAEMVKPAQSAADQVADAMAGIPKTVGPWELIGLPGDLPAPSPRQEPGATGMPNEAQDQWRSGFRDTFRDGLRAAMDGDLGGFLGRFFEQNVSRGLDQAFEGLGGLLDGVIGGLFGKGGAGGGGGLGSMLGTLFSGFFATGGLIPAGRFGIVGERGPEPVIASPKGALVRPNATLSTARMQPAAPSVNMPITIDATGADAAAIGRLNGKLDQLRRDLPGVALRTVQDAGERGILATGAWRR